ncbi:MAG: metal-sensing transcriptional repressor [Clostridia bacterium]|nr:metal-sensing transcriptional repressor [Clostridia bacterium]
MKENNCCAKKTKRGEDEKKLIINRLNRINGQITGIKKMIDNDTYCNDVLIQLKAAQNSIQSLSNHILENHLYNCVTRDLENGDFDTIDELISLFKRFNK